MRSVCFAGLEPSAESPGAESWMEMDCAVTDRWVATVRGAGARETARRPTGWTDVSLALAESRRRHTVDNIGVSAACAWRLVRTAGHQSHDYLLV